MKPKAGFSRFREHVREGGVVYALFRGLKYFVFRLKSSQDLVQHGQNPSNRTISVGKLELVFSGTGINLFYDRRQVTTLAGLNSGIHSLGFWTDSAKADWRVLKEGNDSLRAEVSFKELCVEQIWTVKIVDEREIRWDVITKCKGPIHIDEIRYVALIPPSYKSWFCDYHTSDFPRLDQHWHSLYLADGCVSMVGARFPVQDVEVPSFSLEVDRDGLFPIVQSLPAESHAHILGFRAMTERSFSEEAQLFFSARIHLYDVSSDVDKKIEDLRQQDIKKLLNAKKNTAEVNEGISHVKKSEDPQALLLNLPWQEGLKLGVRAGSRWPHIKDASEGNYVPFPFFLAYAASLLKKNNIQAFLIDAIAEKIAEDDLWEKISNISASYLVVETSVPSFYNDLKFIEKLSRSGRMIILCGPNAEIYKPEFLEQNELVDFVLVGEYEFTLLELIQCLQRGGDLSKVSGLIFRKEGKAVKNSPRAPCDIDFLPWPDRSMPSMEKYWDLPGDIPHPSVQMLASRGCSFGCSFCLWPQVMYGGNHYRARSLEDVVDEMEYLVNERKFKSVYFDDDTFNIGRERMLEFCKLLKNRGLHKVPWAIMARADLMDEALLCEMRSAGLRAVKYGVESPDKKFLQGAGKELDLDKTTQIIKTTQSLGIKTHLTFCFGFMQETHESIQRTIEYAIALDPTSVQFSILTPFPGTALFEELDRAGKILTRDWSRYDGHQQCIFKPDLLTAQDLLEAKKKAYDLWGKHKRKKLNFFVSARKFWACFRARGLKYSLIKSFEYARSF